jgi:hypothetical protein
MQPAEAQRIVQAFGAVLGENTAIGAVRDVASLPYSKAQIKSAIQFALRVTTDGGMHAHFLSAYVSLADFQSLSDGQIKALQEWNKVIGQKRRPTDGELAAEAAAMAQIGKEVIAIHERVAEEAAILANELKMAGFS